MFTYNTDILIDFGLKPSNPPSDLGKNVAEVNLIYGVKYPKKYALARILEGRHFKKKLSKSQRKSKMQCNLIILSLLKPDTVM